MHTPRAMSSAVLAGVVSSVLLLLLAGFLAYGQLVPRAHQASVEADADTVRQILCQAPGPLQELNTEQARKVSAQLGKVGSDSVSAYLPDGTPILFKGRMEAPPGWVAVSDSRTSRAFFPLHDSSCQGSPVSATMRTSDQMLAPGGAFWPAGPQGSPADSLPALYSFAPLTLTSGFSLSGPGGSVYSAQGLVCEDNSLVEGFLKSGGGIAARGDCSARGAWANKDISLETSAVSIAGPVSTFDGQVRSDGSKIAGTVSQQAPPVPVVDILQPSPAPTSMSWAGLLRTLAQEQQAPAWASNGSFCTLTSGDESLPGPLTLPEQDMVVDATACDLLRLDASTAQLDVLLSADLTLLVNDFQAVGAVDFSSSDGQVHSLKILALDPERTCAQEPDQDVEFSGPVSFDPSIHLAVLAEGDTLLPEGFSATGQMAACSLSLAPDVSIAYWPVP